MNLYLEALGLNHPGVEADARGALYEDIVWKSTVIAKATLDAEIVTLVADQLDHRAGDNLNMPLNKTLRDLFLDLETRLRALGSTSGLPDIAASTTPAEFTTALKTILKSYL